MTLCVCVFVCVSMCFIIKYIHDNAGVLFLSLNTRISFVSNNVCSPE